MGYENPRDRLELFLKKIIDKSTAPAERRTRFEQFLAGILDGSLVPDDPRNRLELYLKGVAESGGYTPPSGTLTVTANGIYNVETKKYADVQVPASAVTSGNINLPAILRTVNVTDYRTATIVPTGKTLSIVANGTHPALVIEDGLSYYPDTVEVNVPGGGSLRYDSRQLACVGSHTVTLGWQPQHIIVSWSWVDPEYDPDDPGHDTYITTYHKDLTQTTDITGEGDYVTFTSTGYTFVSVGTGFNDFPTDYSKLTFTAMAVS